MIEKYHLNDQSSPLKVHLFLKYLKRYIPKFIISQKYTHLRLHIPPYSTAKYNNWINSYLHAMENIRYIYIRKRHICVFETIKWILKCLLGNIIVFFIFWMFYGYLNFLFPASMYKQVGGVTIPNILWKAVLASIRSIWPKILTTVGFTLLVLKKTFCYSDTTNKLMRFPLNNDTTFFYYCKNLILTAV